MNCIDFSCVNYSRLIAFGKKWENKTHGKISHSTLFHLEIATDSQPNFYLCCSYALLGMLSRSAACTELSANEEVRNPTERAAAVVDMLLV